MGHKKAIPWIIAAALLMETLDITIVSTALPAMAASFSVDPLSLKIALTSYVLSLAIFIPISGWIADRIGTRTTFMSSIAIFILSSIGCGVAHSLGDIVIGRIIQGIGGALMMPTGRLILLHTFEKKEFIQATAFMTTPALLGPMLGPFFGGWITTYSSWQWIFYVNIPIGIIGLIVSLRYIKNIRNEKCPPFDAWGFTLFGSSMIVLFTLIEAIDLSVVSLKAAIAALFLSSCGFYSFYLHYKKKAMPLINLDLFKIKTFRISTIGSLVSRLGTASISFLLPLFFQVGYDLTPLQSGLLICIWTLGMISIRVWQKKILHRFGFSKVLPTAAIFTGATIICFSKITLTDPYTLTMILFLNGMCSSALFFGINTLCYADIHRKDQSNATSIVSTIQYLSIGIGITISALILHYFVGWNRPLVAGSPAPFRDAFVITGIFVCLASLIFFSLKRTDGAELLQK
ncbi:MAG: MFS transporter [Verrucomicrobiota bacterium]|nr:MFS transporter [Verrucomicrobiota bacterium]